VTVVTIAAVGSNTTAFSSDTGIGEALVIAAKRQEPIETDESVAPTLYVNLRQRPGSVAEAAEIVRKVRDLPTGHGGLLSVGQERWAASFMPG